MSKAKVVMLCRRGKSSAMVYNAMNCAFGVERAIIEDDVPRSVFLRKRIKRLGFGKVVGQVMFSLFIAHPMERCSKNRQQEILSTYGVNDDIGPMMNSDPFFVESVNDEKCIAELKRIQPDVVVVHGTRIISEEVLNCIEAKFINMHAGITPKYRGCHGAYWALYNNDPDNMGVTVHLVDKGVDTGGILYQSVIPITEKDNFTTYPVLQNCIGITDEIKAVKDVLEGNINLLTNNLPSKLYSHPTIFQYLYARIRRKVK